MRSKLKLIYRLKQLYIIAFTISALMYALGMPRKLFVIPICIGSIIYLKVNYLELKNKELDNK